MRREPTRSIKTRYIADVVRQSKWQIGVYSVDIKDLKDSNQRMGGRARARARVIFNANMQRGNTSFRQPSNLRWLSRFDRLRRQSRIKNSCPLRQSLTLPSRLKGAVPSRSHDIRRRSIITLLACDMRYRTFYLLSHFIFQVCYMERYNCSVVDDVQRVDKICEFLKSRKYTGLFKCFVLIFYILFSSSSNVKKVE